MINLFPNDWDLYDLKDICSFQEGPGLRNFQYKDRGIRFINIRCIKEGYLNLSDSQFLSEEEVESKYKHFLLNEGDYVLSSSGTIGRIAIVRDYDLPLLLNTSVIRFRSLDESKLDTKYLYYFLQSDQFFEKISEQSQGSAQVNFGPTHLKLLNAYLPKVYEQKKIANILSQIDKLIQHKRKLKIKYKFILTSLIENLLKGDSTWREFPLSSILSFKNGLNTSKDNFGQGLPFVSYKNVNSGGLLISNQLTSFVSLKSLEEKNFNLKKGDILFTRTSETPDEIGFSAVYNDDAPAVFNGFCIRGRPLKDSILIPEFSSFLFRTNEVLSQMRSLCKFTTRAGISTESLRKVLVRVPDIEVQRIISNPLSSQRNLIEKLDKSINILLNLRQCIFKDFLSGHKRIEL